MRNPANLLSAVTAVLVLVGATPAQEGATGSSTPASLGGSAPQGNVHCLIVGDPTNQTRSTDDGNAIGAIGTYLQIFVGGRIELDHAIEFHHLYRLPSELGRTSPQLTATDVPAVSRMFACDVVAAGELIGSGQSETLSYTLYNSQGVTIGKALDESGSPEQILEEAPDLAAKMAGALGLSPLPAPPIGLTAAQAAEFEQHRWALTPDNFMHLKALSAATTSPVVSVALLPYCVSIGLSDTLKPLYQGLASNLAAMTSSYPIVYGEMAYDCTHGAGYTGPGAIAKSDVDALLEQHPVNAILCRAGYAIAVQEGNFDLQKSLAERLASTYPTDPSALTTAALAEEQYAQSIRKSRTAGAITDDEWSALNSVYAAGLKYSAESVALDPKFEEGWQETAVAATFAGDDDLAVHAFWTANTLDPKDVENLMWGFEMFQPKWLNRPGDLSKTVAMIVANTKLDYKGLDNMVTQLNAPSEVASRDILYRAMAKTFEIPPTGDPATDAPNACSEANEIDAAGDHATAEALYRAALAKYGSTDLKSMVEGGLGVVLFEEGRFSDAIPFLTDGIAGWGYADIAEAHALAESLHGLGRRSEEAKPLNDYIKHASPPSEAIDAIGYLGDLAFEEGRMSEAESYYRQALAQCQPGWRGVYIYNYDIGATLVAQKQYDEGIKDMAEGLSGLNQEIGDINCWELPQALCAVKDYDDAVQICRQILYYKPDDVRTMVAEGKAYFGEKDYSSAHAAWSRAVADFHDAEAAKLLTTIPKEVTKQEHKAGG